MSDHEDERERNKPALIAGVLLLLAAVLGAVWIGYGQPGLLIDFAGLRYCS